MTERPVNQWKTLDKDLNRISHLEQATQYVARPLIAPGLGLAFIIIVAAIAAFLMGGSQDQLIVISAAVFGAFQFLIGLCDDPAHRVIAGIAFQSAAAGAAGRDGPGGAHGAGGGLGRFGGSFGLKRGQFAHQIGLGLGRQAAGRRRAGRGLRRGGGLGGCRLGRGIGQRVQRRARGHAAHLDDARAAGLHGAIVGFGRCGLVGGCGVGLRVLGLGFGNRGFGGREFCGQEFCGREFCGQEFFRRQGGQKGVVARIVARIVGRLGGGLTGGFDLVLDLVLDLVHDLGVDWRAGAAWFEHHLIDHDPASNAGNWLYIAGLGSDPRPVRRFNPEGQADRYDPDGAYRALWS